MLGTVLSGAGVVGWAALAAAPFIGSFLGVLILRLPLEQPIAVARSRCESCGAALRLRDLVPLLSWLAAGGHCRYCGERIGCFYPAVEMAAVTIAVVAIAIDPRPQAWLDCLFGWWLLALAWIDARSWLLPDALTLPLIATGLAAAVLFDPAALGDRAFGAALGWLSLAAVAWVYRRLRGRDGLGGGDAKLLAAAGAWVGAAALPDLILGAATVALVVALCLQLWGVRLGAASALPFGPFLALAAWAIWLFGSFPV